MGEPSGGGRGAGGRPLLGLPAAVLAAAATAFVFDVLVAWAEGYRPPPEYLRLCGEFALAVGLGIASVAALARWREVAALAWWAAASGGLGPATGLDAWILAAGFGALTAPWVVRAQRAGLGGVECGFSVGAAISIVFGCLDLWSALPALGVYALLLLGVYGLTLLRRRFPRAPSPARVALGALVAGVAFIAFWNWLVALVERGPHGDPERRIAGPSILLLVLDTVRADHLSLYGYARETDPNLRHFAETSGGVRVYPRAFSPSSWTLPAHASLFTGKLPSEHSAHSLNWRALFKSRQRQALQAESTLAEELERRGYRTVGVFANPVLLSFPGLGRGFDEYFMPTPRTRGLYSVGEGLRSRLFQARMAYAVEKTPTAEVINRELLRQLDTCDVASCFVFANYMDAHDPFSPPRDVAGAFSPDGADLPPLFANMSSDEAVLRRSQDAYDEMILGLDEALGALLDELERRGVLDRAWLVVTSDHGEAFGEHGVVRHGTGVYNDQVRIPLLIRPPRGEALPEFTGPVSLVDVAATLAGIAGGTLPGRDLRDPHAAPVGIQFFGFARAAMEGEVDLETFGALADTPARAVVDGRDKLIDYGDRVELYRLEDDLAERVDRAGERPDLVEKLRPLLPAPPRGGA